MPRTRWALVAACLISPPAAAQQPQQAPAWAQMPRMQLERQFAGPLQDTIVQRWRDPVDGTICYIYLPITAQHSPPTQSGYVQYGANTIGSISCVAPSPGPAQAASPAPAQRRAAPAPRAPAQQVVPPTPPVPPR
jgi:hypothetical protein